MRGVVKTLRFVQWAVLGSIFLYAAAGEVLVTRARNVDPSLTYAFTTASVGLVGAIFVVRRTLVLRSAENLASHPDDSLTLGHWKTGYIATYALCEALALCGLLLRVLGCKPVQSLPFYIGAVALLIFFGPRIPASS